MACIGRLNRVEYEISLRDWLGVGRGLDCRVDVARGCDQHGVIPGLPSALDLSYVANRKYLQRRKCTEPGVGRSGKITKVVEFKIAASRRHRPIRRSQLQYGPVASMGKLAPRLTTKMNGTRSRTMGNRIAARCSAVETDCGGIFSSE